jgi:SAM-dependent methyltransferase
VYSWFQRLRSLRHRFSYGVSERLRVSRGVFHETPARELPPLPAGQAEKVAALQRRYGVRFEATLSPASSLNNYEYLDILDSAWSAAALPPMPGLRDAAATGGSRAGATADETAAATHARAGDSAGAPSGGLVCDVGCASFYYAAALQAFFRPERLVGVEVEGYRLLKGGHSRADHARGYVSRLPNAEFVIADYSTYECAADVITAWYPFLTPQAILAWRLPLSLLEPTALFARIRRNLKPGGRLFMVNHGPREAEIAHGSCEAVGLRSIWRGSVAPGVGPHRLEPPTVSIWAGSPD